MDYTFEDAIQPYNEEIQSLRQQLVVKDLEVMKLRESFNECVNDFEEASQYKGDYLQEKHMDVESITKYRELLSTTYTPDNLMAWYKEQLGEPFAYTDLDEDFMTKFTHSQYDKLGLHIACTTPLYAPKLDMKG
jgi:hypothetical protein